MKDAFTDLLASRKFWLILIAIIVLSIISHFSPASVNLPETIKQLVGLLVIAIGAENVADKFAPIPYVPAKEDPK